MQGWPRAELVPFPGRTPGRLEPLPRVLRAGKVSCGHHRGESNCGDKEPSLVQVAYNTETSEFHM